MSSYRVQLPVFEGPLDLLLHLIECEELDITTVALAQVTDQYLAYLAELERRQVQVKELADFLVVAAKLVLIKSQALLPRPPLLAPEPGEDVGDELVRQLQVYKYFKEIAASLHEREMQRLRGYVRIAPRPRLDPQLDMGDVMLRDLVSIVQQALNAMPAPPVGEVVAPITVTIAGQVAHIENRLTRRPRVRFREILSEAVTRIEVIVTLLALLELIKQDRVRVRQEELFGEIVIERQTAVEAAPPDVEVASPTA